MKDCCYFCCVLLWMRESLARLSFFSALFSIPFCNWRERRLLYSYFAWELIRIAYTHHLPLCKKLDNLVCHMMKHFVSSESSISNEERPMVLIAPRREYPGTQGKVYLYPAFGPNPFHRWWLYIWMVHWSSFSSHHWAKRNRKMAEKHVLCSHQAIRQYCHQGKRIVLCRKGVRLCLLWRNTLCHSQRYCNGSGEAPLQLSEDYPRYILFLSWIKKCNIILCVDCWLLDECISEKVLRETLLGIWPPLSSLLARHRMIQTPAVILIATRILIHSFLFFLFSHYIQPHTHIHSL